MKHPSPTPTDSRQKGSRSVRALEILEAMTAAGEAMTVADIVAATGLPKATVHRLCSLLEGQGFLVPDIDSKGLRPGHRTRQLALGLIATGGDDAYRHQILTRVSERIGETCNLNAPMGNEMIYIDRVETKWPLRTQLPIGSRVPLHCTASGKLYLSSLPERRRLRLVGALRLERHTPNTVTDRRRLLAMLDSIAGEQVSTDDQEFIDGMTAIALPVTDSKGRLAAALACHAPTSRMPLAVARAHIPVLREAARALSAEHTK